MQGDTADGFGGYCRVGVGVDTGVGDREDGAFWICCCSACYGSFSSCHFQY